MKEVYAFLVKIGINPIAFYTFLIGLPSFIRDYRKFKRKLTDKSEFPFSSFYPIMMEKKSDSGKMRGAYFHQDLLVARMIFENNPVRHVDIGSRIDGFVAHVAVFREIEVFDIRKQTSTVKNIIFKQADFMQLAPDLIEYSDSISSLHAIEHFGLGRYGDPIDPNGHLKGIESMYKMLKPGGTFYFAVPMGRQRIEFNAHRIFGLSYLLKILKDKFSIEYFSYVDDAGDLYENVELIEDKIGNNYGVDYGCAIFKLKKKIV
jgi:hypothetical protein